MLEVHLLICFRTLNKKARGRKSPVRRKCSQNDESMEGSIPALPAEPGTLKVYMVLFIKPSSQVDIAVQYED